MTEQELELAIALLGLTLTALAGSIALGGYQVIAKYKESKASRLEIELNNALDQTMIEVHLPAIEAPVKKNYRHNVHCPTCGKFSKKFEGSTTIVVCAVHQIQVRWKDEPIDWRSKPVTEGVTISFDDAPVYEFSLAVEPLTQPIDIIVPDDLSKLMELGARI